MEAKEWTTINKGKWPRGEWDNEPDKAQWPDPVTGMACLAVRNPHIGQWCGYVGIVTGHRYYKLDYSECPQNCDDDYCGHCLDSLVEIHGGVTFAGECRNTEDEAERICHVDPDGPEVWWFGFDCGHAGDNMPVISATVLGDVYRSLAYVRKQCASLAKQLATIEAQS